MSDPVLAQIPDIAAAPDIVPDIPQVEYAPEELAGLPRPENFQETQASATRRWMAEKLAGIPKDQVATEQTKQALAMAVSDGLGIPIAEAYKNAYGLAAAWTGVDVRGDPGSMWDQLKSRSGAVADFMSDTQTTMKINTLRARAMDLTDKDPESRGQKEIQAQIDALTEKLHGPDVWDDGGPWGVIKAVGGFGVGISHASLAFLDKWSSKDEGLDSYLKQNAISVTPTPNTPTPVFADGARLYAASTQSGGLMPGRLWEQADALEPSKPKVESTWARDATAFFSWGTDAVPLVGELYRQAAAPLYGDMKAHGVDDLTAQIMARSGGLGMAALQAWQGSVGAGQLKSAVGEELFLKIAGKAEQSAWAKNLLNGGYIVPLAKEGIVKLSTTTGGKMLTYAAEQGVSVLKQTALGAAATMTGDLAYNFTVAFADETGAELAGREYDELVRNAKQGGVDGSGKYRPGTVIPDRDTFISQNRDKYIEKYRDVFENAVQSIKDNAVMASSLAFGGGVAKALIGGFKPGSRPVTPADIASARLDLAAERDLAEGPMTAKDVIDSFRAPDETGVAPKVTTGFIRVSDTATGDRMGPGIRVSTEAPVHDSSPISPASAEAAVRARVPEAQANAFAEALSGRAPASLAPELRILADRVKSEDISPETMAVAQRYGIETPGPKYASVDFKSGNFATLNAEEMQNPGASIAAYKAQGFDGVWAGKEAYVFKPENLIKTADVERPSVIHLDPQNSRVIANQNAVKIESNGQAQELPVTREGNTVSVSGEVSPFVADRVAKELVASNEGKRLDSENPVLRRAIEDQNPDAPAIRDRIGFLETRLKNLEEAGAGPRSIRDATEELQVTRDSLTTPTEAWKRPAPHQASKAEFTAQQRATMEERKALGNSPREQLLKAAPNVTEAQAKTFSEVLDRMQGQHADKIVSAIVSDETLDGKNGAAELLTGVMRLNKDATFDTAMHELMHLSWVVLSDSKKADFIESLKLKTDDNGNLTREGHEKFADSFRLYAKQKEGGSPLFEQVKAFILDLVNAISGKLSKKAMAGFDELLGEGDTKSHDASGTDGPPNKPSPKVQTPSGVRTGESPLPNPESVDGGRLESRQAMETGNDAVGSPSVLYSEERLAPNGKPSKLDAQQYSEVRTPEFKAWFGDWEKDPANASKVVDENGEPMVVYHGGKDRIEAFDPAKVGSSNSSWYGLGFYFTGDIKYAKYYGDSVTETYLDIRKPLEASHESQVWAEIENQDDPVATTKEIVRRGYDGVFVPGPGEGIYEVVALSPTQIKSATDNIGTFDAENPSILFQRATTSEHERLIQKALKEDKYVPDHVIEDYLEKPWAIEEWRKRHPEDQRELERTALTTETPEAFIEKVTSDLFDQEAIPEVIRGLPKAELDSQLRDFWDRTNHPENASATAKADWEAAKAKVAEAEKAFDPDNLASDQRQALVLAARSEEWNRRTIEQQGAILRYQTNLEAMARIRIGNLEAKLADAKGDKTALKNALSDARAEHKLTLRKMEEARSERRTMENLAKSIMRPISSKTVDVSTQRMLREIQAGLDPKFRRQSTVETRQSERRFYAEVLKGMEDSGEFSPDDIARTQAVYDKASKKSLSEFTMGELNELASAFRGLYDKGRAILKAKEDAFRSEVDESVSRTVSGMRKTKGRSSPDLAMNAEVLKGYEGTLVDKLRTLTHDPQRVLDYLDGGKNFEGENFSLFYRKVDEAVNEEIRQEQAFMREFEQTLRENGFESATGRNPSVSSLYKQVEVRGQKWQAQEIMDVYLKWKNDRSRAALIGDGERSGNKIDQELHDELVAALSPEQKAVADWMLDYYNRPDTKTKLADFHEGFANTPFVDEANYTPIERIGRFKERSEAELKAELMGRSSSVMGTIDRSNTKERVDIAAHNQTPLKLGAVDTLISYQHHMAHYMSHAEPLKLLDAVYADKAWQGAVMERLGNVGVDAIGRFLDRVKNPNIDKNPAWYFGTFRQAAGNIGKAYMSYNPKTILRQIPAFLYFAGELDNPLMLMRGIAEVNAGWGEAWTKMAELSPQWATRVQDPIMREIINGTKDNYVKMISDMGMKGIGMVDQVVAGWGWWAKFIEGTEKYGLSEKEAARAADEAMNRTQQVSRTKDEAELYSKNEFLKWWTMFTGPLNKLWGQMTYDVWNRPGGARKAFTAMGIFTAGTAGWIVANGKPPTTEEDWKQIVTGEVFGAPVPIIGSSVVNWAYGYERTGRLSPWEFVSEAGDAVKAGEKLVTGQYNPAEGMAKIADKTYGAIALATGAPLVEVRRAFKLASDGMNGREVDLRELIGKDYGR